MTIKRKTPSRFEKIQYDLTGSAGKAFAVLGFVENLAKQSDWKKEEIENLLNDMTSEDYDHLIKCADEKFGHVVDFLI